jgi:hypothetical protein
MNFDLRLPIGLIFSLFGAILAIYGFTNDPTVYAKALNINVNLYWGLVMLAFGVVMLFLALRSRNSPPSAK